MYTKIIAPISILLVEDNPGDARLAKEAMKDSKIANKLNVVGDGFEALKYLRKEGEYNNAVRPDLILLDLNLPKIGGQEVLEIVKNEDDLKSIPIIILTTSKSEEDILQSYKLHANCFITKPIDLNQFIKVVKSIESFWLSIVRLPNYKA